MSDNLVRLERAATEVIDFDGMSVICFVGAADARRVIQAAFTETTGLNAAFAAPDASVEVAVGADVILVHALSENEALERAKTMRATPALADRRIIVMSPTATNAATARLIEAGADDVIPAQPTASEVLSSLTRAKAARRVFLPTMSGNDQRGPGKTIVFMHASGGAGATTLAVNAALLLHQQAARNSGSACLLDLDVQFGDAHVHLDLRTQSNVGDLITSPDRLDQRMLQHLMMDGPSGLKVLTSSAEPLPLDAVTPEMITSVMTHARRQHRYVVVDMPVALSRWTAPTLRMADHIFVVTQLNVANLLSTKRLVAMILESGIDPRAISIIANRAGAKASAEGLSLAQAAKAIGQDVQLTIPNDYAPVIESLDQGAPLAISKPTSKVARALNELLSEKVDPDLAPKRSSGGAIFGFSLQGKR